MALGHLTLVVQREEGDGSGWLVRSPAVGRLVDLPRRGTLLQGGSPAGVLRVLRREFVLVLPENCRGAVAERLVEGKRPPVQYGQPLFRLGAGVAPANETRATAETRGRGELEIPAGMLAVRSPTDGVFYRRPNPEADPYVVEGSEITHGSTLALVEVMKCFQQIVYGREEESPDRGRIHRILVEDAHEVQYGQLLFVIDPL